MVVRLVRGLGLPLCMAALWACSSQEEVSGEALCEDAAQAVAQRTLSCGEDVEVGNERFHWVMDQARCIAKLESSGTPSARCSDAIRKLTCEEVEAIGDDVSLWITRAECAEIFDLADASVPDGGAP